MKRVVVTFLLSATGFAMASETPKSPQPVVNMEEVVVTGYYWNTEELRGKLMVGLSGEYLIHEYDKKRDEWRFVRASSERKGTEE